MYLASSRRVSRKGQLLTVRPGRYGQLVGAGTAVLHDFTDVVGDRADDAGRDDLRAAGAKLGLEEAGARPGWLRAAFYRVAGVGAG